MIQKVSRMQWHRDGLDGHYGCDSVLFSLQGSLMRTVPVLNLISIVWAQMPHCGKAEYLGVWWYRQVVSLKHTV